MKHEHAVTMSFYLQFQFFWDFVCPTAVAAGGAAAAVGTGGAASAGIAVGVATGTAGCQAVRRSRCKREVSIIDNVGYRT